MAPLDNGLPSGGHRNGHARDLDWLHPHDVAARLSPDAWRKHGSDAAYALCPVHSEDTPSLHISRKNGELLLHCFACGEERKREIIAALTAKGIGLFSPEPVPAPRKAAAKAKASAPTKVRKPPQGQKTWVADHLYHDDAGTVLYRKRRYEWHLHGKRVGKGKTFLWERSTPDGWKAGRDGGKAPLYRLHEIAASGLQAIHWAEGEKCADAIASLGLVATTLPERSLDGQDLSACAGHVVFYHADADRIGDVEAQRVMLALAGIAERVVVVRYEQGDVADWLAGEGVGLKAFLEHCERFEGQEPPEETPPQALEFDDQITIETRVDALVKGVLHPGDIAAIYGVSGVGKTFCAIDLAYHVAHGRPWNGRRVRQAPVLYVGLEGVRGLRHRMAACAREMGSAGRMLARLTVHTPLDKSEPGNAGEATTIQQAKALGGVAGKPVGLIIIDTLARAIAGDDENSAQDMAAFIGRVSAIARETGAAVLVVHHPGKDDARGMRGSTALFAACDAVIKIAANGNVREVAAEKVKDGEIGSLFSYTLTRVSLGIDEDGDEITSCIVQPIQHAPTPRRVKLSAQHQRALDQLHRLYTDGVARCIDPKVIGLADIDPRCIPRVATREEWRSRCEQAELTNTGNANSERSAFKRAVDELEKAGLIARFGEYVWLLGQKSAASHWAAEESMEATA